MTRRVTMRSQGCCLSRPSFRGGSRRLSYERGISLSSELGLVMIVLTISRRRWSLVSQHKASSRLAGIWQGSRRLARTPSCVVWHSGSVLKTPCRRGGSGYGAGRMVASATPWVSASSLQPRADGGRPRRATMRRGLRHPGWPRRCSTGWASHGRARQPWWTRCQCMICWASTTGSASRPREP